MFYFQFTRREENISFFHPFFQQQWIKMGDSEDSRKIWEKLVLNTERNVDEVMEFYVEWAKTVSDPISI